MTASSPASTSPRLLGIALVLGMISAVGPFAIDMYLPALPVIGRHLHADMAQVQLSLMSFFIALGVGQLLYGPVSDRVGRKPPLYFGMGLFALASVGCALAGDIQTLIGLRFVQGLGAAAGMAIPRAVVRDLHTGTDAARLMSLLMLVFSVSPILAPLAGSTVIALSSWRAVFWVVALAALLSMGLMALSLQETRSPQERLHTSLGSALAGYWLLLRDSHFMALVLVGSFAMAGFFTYLANSSFVLIGHWGLTPTQYSLAFAINAAAFIGASQFTGALGDRFGLVPLVRWAALASAMTVLVLVLYFALGGDRLAVLIGLYLIASAFMGLVIPSSAVLALEAHGALAGTASALMGTLQMLIGAAAMALASIYNNGQPLPMVCGMAVGAWLALAIVWRAVRVPGLPPVATAVQARNNG